MSRGGSSVSLVGNVGDPIVYGKTKSGEPCGSFMLAMEGKTGSVVWAKANWYGEGITYLCMNRLRRGDTVTVIGALMNRTVPGTNLSQLEIRIDQIFFQSPPISERGSAAQENKG